MSVTLRLATLDDWAPLLQWRNDEETRRASFNQVPVSRDEHMDWLRSTLQRGDSRIYIAEDAASGVAIGTCRLDLRPAASGQSPSIELSLAVAPAHRGQGYARQIIDAAIQTTSSTPAFQDAGIVRAVVKTDNARSLRAFSACGFRPVRRDDGSMVLERPRPR